MEWKKKSVSRACPDGAPVQPPAYEYIFNKNENVEVFTGLFFFLESDVSVPASSYVSTLKTVLVKYWRTYDVPFENVKDMTELRANAHDGRYAFLLPDLPFDVNWELSRSIAEYDRFTGLDMGDMVNLCRYILKHWRTVAMRIFSDPACSFSNGSKIRRTAQTLAIFRMKRVNSMRSRRTAFAMMVGVWYKCSICGSIVNSRPDKASAPSVWRGRPCISGFWATTVKTSLKP